MITVFACFNTGRNKDVTYKKKCVTAFGHSKKNNVEEVTEFACVSHCTMTRFLGKQKKHS